MFIVERSVYEQVYIALIQLITASMPIRRLTTIQHFPLPKAIPIPVTKSSESSESSTPSTMSPLAPLVNTSHLYMTVHINSFPYLISPNDTLNLPFHLPDAPLGSILRMTHVSRIGVRDYTLQGTPYIDEQVFTLKMRVIEHTKMPLVITVKTKQRQRRARHLPNKQNYTVLKYVLYYGETDNRVCEMKVHNIDPSS